MLIYDDEIKELIDLFLKSKRLIKIKIYTNSKKIYVCKSDYTSVMISPSSKVKLMFMMGSMNLYYEQNIFREFLNMLKKDEKFRDKLKSILEKEILLSNVDI